MIIDAHTHVKHGDKDRTEVPAERIVSEMDRAGVDWSVIFAINLPSRASHEMTLREQRKFPTRLIPFAHGLPHEGQAGEKEVRRAVKELGFAGVKLHFGEFLRARGHLPDPEELHGMFDAIAELDVPALVDIRGAIDTAEKIPEQHPALKLILAHLGSPMEAEIIDRAIALCCAHENVWLDCSYCFLPEKIPEAIRRCGARKIIFGSDGYSPQIDLAEKIRFIRALRLPPGDEARILGGNIRELLAGHWAFEDSTDATGRHPAGH